MTTEQKRGLKPRVWFITGASSGFGRHLAESVLESGDSVIGTARRPGVLESFSSRYGDRFLGAALDLTRPDGIADALQIAVERFSRVDVLVNNAGATFLGAIEETSAPEGRSVLEVNFFGPLAVLQEVLPLMRRQRSGHIITISSLGGFVGIPGSGLFNAAKFAMEGLSEALRKEVEPLGIKVTIVEPGGFRTGAGHSLTTAALNIQDYDQTSGQTIRWIKEYAEKAPGDPAKAAVAIRKLVASDSPPQRLVLGADALTIVREKLQGLTEELSEWEQISASTDLD